MNNIAFRLSEFFISPFSESTGGGPDDRGYSGSVSDIIGLFLKGALAIAGVALLVIMIGAGIALISSAGSGKPEDASRAAKTATSALIGFLIVMAAYLIVQLLGKFLTGNLEMITSPSN